MAKYKLWNVDGTGFDDVPSKNISYIGRLVVYGSEGDFGVVVEISFSNLGASVAMWGTGEDAKSFAGRFNVEEQLQLRKLSNN